MNTGDYFISCDWGTTNFRLRLVETLSLRVLAVHSTDQGIKTLYEKFRDLPDISQQQYFSKYLESQLKLLPAEHQNHLIILTGMVSSNIGLLELEYADMPFDQSGSGLNWSRIALDNGLEALLISGVKSQSGMMRGEETQAIGLADHLPENEEGILLLPGTHSKHLVFSTGKFTRLRNFMTGELFEVLSNNSILANSVKKGDWDVSAKEAFQEGLSLGVEGKLTSSLLSIRAGQVIRQTKKENNYYLLSGMIIGDELSYLKNYQGKIFLGAPDAVSGLYQLALEFILKNRQFIKFEESVLEQALLIGQKKILELDVK